MPYQEPKYKGDKEYRIDTKDVVVGDEIRFERATFSGTFRNPTFAGFELVTAKVIKDSYGQEWGQHTFTLLLPDGKTMRIKGRNLYKNGVYRKPWPDEKQRDKIAEEKHTRGDKARKKREDKIWNRNW